MSTEIKDLVRQEDFLRLRTYSDRVEVRAEDTSPGPTRQYSDAVVSRADFLAAVAAECDAIVIPREDLPEVKHLPDGRPFAETDRGYGDYQLEPKDTPERLRDHARALLALAEYRDANPPADEAQVEALAEAIRAVEANGMVFASTLARELVADGWSKAVRP